MPPKTSSPSDRGLQLQMLATEELSNGFLDCHHACGCADDRAVDSVLHLVHPSREGARTYLVHVVEAAGASRHWRGHGRSATDSTGRRRCARGALLIG